MSGVPGNIAHWVLAEGVGADVALREGDRQVTYDELRARTRTAAGLVRAFHGAVAGERPVVPVIGETSIELVAAYLGALYAGAIPAPLAPASPDVLREIAAQTGARLALVAADTIDRARGAFDAVVPLAELTAAPLADAVDVEPDATASLMYTSGSTGRPRAVMVSTRNLWANARGILAMLPLTADDRALVTLPLYYCYGASVVHTHLRAGASVVLTREAFPEELLASLHDSGATGLPAVPSILQMLVTRSSIASRPPPRLRYVMSSGGRLPERTIAELRAALPSTQLVLRYGVTELTAAASFLPPDRVGDKRGSIGRGLPGAPLHVERDDGTPVAPGEVGEIIVRGDSVALGYLGDPEETARSFRAGAFHTGDLATVDSDGFVVVVGRAKEFVKTGGHRVAPQEVEEVLHRLPGVHGAAVCGVPHAMRGEALVAAVVPREGVTLTEAELRAQCNAQLPPYKVPTRFMLVRALPRRPNGKLDRAALAAELSAPDAP